MRALDYREVDAMNFVKHGADARRIFEIDLDLTVAGRTDDLVLACRESLGDLDADSAGGSDDDNFHEHLRPADYACTDVSRQP
jgi:hypothetical protein